MNNPFDFTDPKRKIDAYIVTGLMYKDLAIPIKLIHGQTNDLIGRSIVSADGGKFCEPSSNCDWCKQLRMRITSRTGMNIQ